MRITIIASDQAAAHALIAGVELCLDLREESRAVPPTEPPPVADPPHPAELGGVITRLEDWVTRRAAAGERGTFECFADKWTSQMYVCRVWTGAGSREFHSEFLVTAMRAAADALGV